ncbi:hypothetical protein L195_g003119 [Trifolium pratense]|uniref:Uncharacterized protein n=1 Tax=Trifolium pratense TaxID=57577 RepID=A0A2K3NUC2_TRIPR|nr:hypothetical protein L195_g003119 [Trifolium pratense]
MDFGYELPSAVACFGEEFGSREASTSWMFDGSAWLARAMALLRVKGPLVLDIVSREVFFEKVVGMVVPPFFLKKGGFFQKRGSVLISYDVSASGRVLVMLVSLTIPTFVCWGKGYLQSF